MKRSRFLLCLVLAVLALVASGVSAEEVTCLACDHSSPNGCGPSPWPDFGGLRCEQRCLTWCFNGACSSLCYCATSGTCAILPPGFDNGEPLTEAFLANPSPALRDQLDALSALPPELRGVLLLLYDRQATDYQGTLTQEALNRPETRVVYSYAASLRRLDAESHEMQVEIFDHPTVRAIVFMLYEQGKAASVEIERKDEQRRQVFHLNP